MVAAVLLIAGSGLSHAQTADVAMPPPVGPSPNICLPGTGSLGWCGDGDLATSAKLAGPGDVAVAPDGSVVVADTENQVIRSIDPAGRIQTIAGTGVRGIPDAVAARRTMFQNPQGVAVDADGSVLVADTDNHALRRITVSGRMATVAPASRLYRPTDVVLLPDGGYAVADFNHNRVVRVSAGGTITPIAGTGTAGYSGDGGPATAARLKGPHALASSPAGLLIVDSGNRIVRRVAADGTISTVAGRAPGAPAGPTPATQLTLESPRGVAATAAGGFVVSSVHRLWTVGADGSVQPFAGTGVAGFSGDTGAALSLRLDRPAQLATTADGAILVADRGSDRVRRIAPDGSATTLAGSDDPTISLPRVASAPFRPARRRPTDVRVRRVGGRLRFRGRVLRPRGAGGEGQSNRSYSPGADSGGGQPPCAAGSTTANYLKIRPYTQVPVHSGAKRVVIKFGMTVDAKLTAYAWRKGVQYGNKTRKALAGPKRRITLRGRLAPKRYYAVLLGVTVDDQRVCDSRPLEVE